MTSLPDDNLSLEGWDVVAKRERAIKPRMAWVDSLTSQQRALMNVLPLPSLLAPCIEAGCRTPGEAEDWFRSIVHMLD